MPPNTTNLGRHGLTRSDQDDAQSNPVSIEIYVGTGFCGYETTAIVEVLSRANTLLRVDMFSWRFVSQTPGLLKGKNGLLLRAEPAIDNYGYSDIMIVVGGASGAYGDWLKRARSVNRNGHSVILLSDAATTYIRKTTKPPGHVTTHWADAANLEETGFHPNLTTKLTETSGGIVTAAGAGATAEIVIGRISKWLTPDHIAELGRLLLLPVIRKSDADQPRTMADNPGLFDARVTAAIRMMEDTISEPLSMSELTDQIGVSSRHLERVFKEVFDQSPARFYKNIRTKRARAMIEETLLPLADIAVATGFGSTNTMSQAVRDTYGMSPTKMRTRKRINLVKAQ